jgi:bile acid:Na+ symporter, BASS family
LVVLRPATVEVTWDILERISISGAGESIVKDRHGWITAVSHFVHKHFIWMLVGSYSVAAVWPTLGLTIRKVSLGEITFFHETTKVSLPILMLAFLLLNAGLGVNTAELRNLLKNPRVVFGGLAANLLIPLTFIFTVSQVLRLYHDPVEAQHILVGLALIVAMPIAGSSTAWSQNANGDIALSLALVLFSTLLSPLTTPVAFDAVEHMATGEYAEALDRLELNCTGFLLIACVLLPSVAGIALHWLIGAKRVIRARPVLKLLNSINLLLLNYSNAAVSLPQLMNIPDWDWLAVALVIALLLCVVAFASGWLIARLLKANPSEQISLMFGLGMNNNGTGLVLASMALAQYPRVMVPVIFYNLIQHLVAGFVDSVWCRSSVESTD